MKYKGIKNTIKNKMSKTINKLILGTAIISSSMNIAAQDISNKEGSDYNFKVIKDLEATKVQAQNSTGTCWSFSSLSFFESRYGAKIFENRPIK